MDENESYIDYPISFEDGGDLDVVYEIGGTYRHTQDTSPVQDKPYYTRAYYLVTPDGPPGDLGLYEHVVEAYALSEDEELDEEKVYYDLAYDPIVEPDVEADPSFEGWYQEEEGAYYPSDHETVDEDTVYYIYDYGAVEPDGEMVENPFALGYYEWIEDGYAPTQDLEIIPEKGYFEAGYDLVEITGSPNPSEEGWYEYNEPVTVETPEDVLVVEI